MCSCVWSVGLYGVLHIRNARLFSMKKLCSTPRPRWIQQAGRKQGLGARGRSSRGPLEASREKRRPEARTRASARVTRCAGAANSRGRCRRGGVGGDPGKQQSRARGEPPPAELDGVSHLGANTQGKYGRGGWTRGGAGGPEPSVKVWTTAASRRPTGRWGHRKEGGF